MVARKGCQKATDIQKAAEGERGDEVVLDKEMTRQGDPTLMSYQILR